MDDLTNYIGIGAGIFTGLSLLPQLFKIIKQKKPGDISFYMLFILMAGLAGWIWYGSRKNDLPIIFTNTFSFITNLLIIFFSLHYKSKIPGNNSD
jgi:MtN3 and saliva related transmembrane protein